ncbi:hypothetical protein [Streptomyces sp. A1547]|uniref:hypothetical protein n=1 Tax=Streptomyces sp. A1547 TaxID=2563105 RepID=UPI00109E6CF3|nr:hypothetical protein [Streptomyces sp. A1547]THA30903.1 hypothetical protein E6W17_36710 [Streptomyces sp. A1547]
MEDPETRPVESHRRQRFEVVHKWSATAAAVVALVISLYNFAELHRQPSIEMTLPHLFRLEKLGDGVRFYVRPTVSTRFKSEDVEVITEARLQLTPTDANSISKRPVFYWRESVEWYYDPDSDTVNNRWSGDPAPFIVSQDKPQQPSFEFRASGWMYQAGRYEDSLLLLRSGDRAPLIKKFCLIISAAAVNELQNPQPPDQTIRFFRNDLPKFASSGSDAGCYRRDMD